jgi:4-hydroxybenzoate polyprenyltransferase
MRVFDFLKSLAQLVRLPNVLIIILTMLLLRYCILLPYLLTDSPDAISALPDFLALVLVTLLIAVGGYVINDYFDIKIDGINRPGKMVVNKLISARAAIKLHLVLSGVAILLGFYLGWRVKSIGFGLVFPFITGLLWIYSAKYKRTLFWGNFIVAGLSAFVIIIVWLFEFFWLRLDVIQFAGLVPDIRGVSVIFMAYATFAFLVSMVREIIKDMEDVEGDQAVGCKTLPIVIGMQFTRYIAGGILLLTFFLLVVAQVTLYNRNLDLTFWYFMFGVQPVILLLLFSLFRAHSKRNYHFLSNLCKFIMVAGILSMVILFISN